jgi:hypothetical protein
MFIAAEVNLMRSCSNRLRNNGAELLALMVDAAPQTAGEAAVDLNPA